MKRILGSYTQNLPGPLLICTCGLHGNEWAGVRAMDLLFKMLEVEPITNPGFRFYGKLVAIAGNIPALKVKQRYINLDLNRIWSARNLDNPGNEVEFGELVRLKKTIDQLVIDWGGESIFLLDLHTTTATGGIFLLPTQDERSVKIARSMHAPIITGLVEKLKGTLIRYYTERTDVDLNGLVFEAGQHDDPLSVNRSIAAVINCMRSIGNVVEQDIENRHNELLIEYSRDLPIVSEFLYAHQIHPEDEFEMNPGYRNFDPVAQDQILARDRNGVIRAKMDGMVLMPHYQKLGDDGFFIIRKLE